VKPIGPTQIWEAGLILLLGLQGVFIVQTVAKSLQECNIKYCCHGLSNMVGKIMLGLQVQKRIRVGADWSQHGKFIILNTVSNYAHGGI
jgi:hypothetical protein